MSHACDYPRSFSGFPGVTSTRLSPNSPGATIDAAVRRLREAGHPVIAGGERPGPRVPDGAERIKALLGQVLVGEVER